jgi:hypothetical protein
MGSGRFLLGQLTIKQSSTDLLKSTFLGSSIKGSTLEKLILYLPSLSTSAKIERAQDQRLTKLAWPGRVAPAGSWYSRAFAPKCNLGPRTIRHLGLRIIPAARLVPAWLRRVEARPVPAGRSGVPAGHFRTGTTRGPGAQRTDRVTCRRGLLERRPYGTFLCRGPSPAGLHSSGPSNAREEAEDMTAARGWRGLCRLGISLGNVANQPVISSC